MAKVSILIPCYNAALYLDTTIKSVVQQTLDDWELIILDDCSTDQTFQMALHWQAQDTRIRAFRNPENLGMLRNWNKGISLCISPFFVKLDADDIWDSYMLEKAMRVLDSRPEVGLVFSRYVNIDEQGRIMDGTDVALPDFARNKAFSCIPIVKEGPGQMLAYPILRQGLSVMRREIFEKIGLYRFLLSEETQAATDTEFYFRVGAHYQVFCLDEVLYYYRVHTQSISAADKKGLLTQKKLYEIKKVIIEYYFSLGLLHKDERKQFLSRVEREYNFACIAASRQANRFFRFSRLLLLQLLADPVNTFLFYKSRIKERRHVGSHY